MPLRDPVGAIVAGMDIHIFTGNQFQGGGNPGNQLQTATLHVILVERSPTRFCSCWSSVATSSTAQ